MARRERTDEMQAEEEIWEPNEIDLKLRRYGFLFGIPKFRMTAAELLEKKALLAELRALNRDPGWEK